jgi:MFS family permease
LCVLLIGVGGGVLNGATNSLTADVSPGERGSKLSLLGVFFGVGALTMPSALAVLSRSFTLSSIVAGIGALVLVPIAYCLAIRFPAPKQRSERAALAATLAMFRDPFFTAACLALAVQSGMEGMTNDWMTRYLDKTRLTAGSQAEWQAQLGLVAVTLAITLSRLTLAGVLRLVSARIVLLGSVVLAAAGATVLLTGESYELALVGALLVGAGLAAGFPVVLGCIGDRYPQQSGAAFSTAFVVALVGNMAINKTFGAVAQQYGVGRYPLVLLACLAASAALLAIVLRSMTARPARDVGPTS